jgi:integrase/recombinase XerD
MDAHKAIDSFIAYIAAEKGLSKNTALAYRSDLMKFAAFIKEKDLSLDLIAHQNITDFLMGMKDDGLKPATIYRMTESIRQFYKFLSIEEILDDNPAEEVAVPKLAEKLPTVLSKEEVVVLLNSVNENKIHAIRNRAMFELLYATGMRVSELVNLRFSDLDMKSNFVKVFGKGSKERLAPFGDIAKRFLKIYFAKRPQPKSPQDYVFLSKSGGKLTRVAVWQHISAAGRKAGIAKEIYPHIFRHSCASHLLEGGADIRFVQEILGHSKISSTQIYTHLDARQIQEKHKKYHPRG